MSGSGTRSDDGVGVGESPAGPEVRAGVSRPVRLVRAAVAVTLGLVAIYLSPDIGYAVWKEFRLLLPSWLRWALETWVWFLLFAAVAVPLTRRPRRVARWAVPGVVWDRLDDLGTRSLRLWLAVALTVLAGVWLVGWVPHYLIWPWWSDSEYFALTAQAWEAGILPYRDLFDFNFPGPTYLHWLLGRAFGWGHTVPFQAFDAILLVTLGAAMAWWSRVRLGGVGPGLVGYVAVLVYYLSLNYALTAQRDWLAPVFVVLSVFCLEAWRGRWALVASGLLFALALSFRPHPVVLLPAVLAALDEHAREPGGSWRATARAAAVWSAVCGLGLVVAAAPVVLAGVADDFAHWFRLAWYGGTYDRHWSGRRSRVLEVVEQLARWETSAVLAAVVALAVGGPALRRTARTWALALLGVLLYKPLSPYPHTYLSHPLMLVWSVALAVAVAWAWGTSRLVPSARALLVVTVLVYAIPRWPVFWAPRASVAAVASLARGRPPGQPPPGCAWFMQPTLDGSSYSWENYCELLAYLRGHTSRHTRVANFIREHPFPTVNGPVGRLPVFPSPGGILWLRFAAPGQEGPFDEALARPGDSVVVWAPQRPGEPGLRLRRLEDTVRRLYEPEARFGVFEVWRRKPGGPETRAVAPAPPDGRLVPGAGSH